jgi:hypothetical protein
MTPSQSPELERFAAPAPTEDGDQPPVLDDRDRDLDVLCERWVSWCRSRRLYGPAPISGTVLGRLSGSTRPLKPGSGDAVSSAELSAFHIAYTCQPRDALDRQVFDAYYVHRIKPIKKAADALKISRKHFYDVLKEFRVRVFNASTAIQADNETHRARLLASPGRRSEADCLD